MYRHSANTWKTLCYDLLPERNTKKLWRNFDGPILDAESSSLGASGSAALDAHPSWPRRPCVRCGVPGVAVDGAEPVTSLGSDGIFLCDINWDSCDGPPSGVVPAVSHESGRGLCRYKRSRGVPTAW